MSLKDNFYGLGHSSTFLGPNLDSYFITYHDMNPDGVRTFNISRLLFSNNMMTVNDVNNDLHFNIEMPDFESRNKSEFLSKNNAYFYKNSFKKLCKNHIFLIDKRLQRCYYFQVVSPVQGIALSICGKN